MCLNTMAICAEFEFSLSSRRLKFILEKGTGLAWEQNNIHKLYSSPQQTSRNSHALIMENFSPDILAGVRKRTCNTNDQAILIGGRTSCLCTQKLQPV